MLKAMLTKLGHEVSSVDNGRDAIEFLNSQEPMLVLLDWVMPEVPGPVVIENLRRKEMKHYIIMLTAKNEKEDVATALDAGANDYITKPFDPEELRARVDAGARVLEAEAKMREANERMSEFVGIVSHDLRNPIGTIISVTDLLELSSSHLKECLPLIRQSSKRALSIITDLLDLTAIESSRNKLKIESRDVKGLVESCLKICQVKADEKSIQIQTSFPVQTLAFFDDNRLAQVIDNLLSNAIKFTPRNGLISINCEEKEESLEIRITDSGVGIPADALPNLFRKDVSYSTKGTDGEKGTGFGLPLAQEIVKAHGSELVAESEYGKGSVFYFSLEKSS